MFHLYESPKFLLSRNRQAEAVAVVQGVARFNGTVTWLSEDLLNEFGDDVDDGMPKLSALEINKRNLSKFSFDKVGALFAEKSLGITTVLLWFMWASIGMHRAPDLIHALANLPGLGFPLFNSFLLQWLEHAGQQGSVAVSADVVSDLSPINSQTLRTDSPIGISELSDNLRCRGSWQPNRCIHSRHQRSRPQGYHGHLDIDQRRILVSLHII